MDAKYSDVLELLGANKQARQTLIRGYFEKDADADETEKAPTKAHRAIAQLVKGGFLKTIVTTNFDRLMEIALQEVGISPVVIATQAQVIGAGPIHRNTCTVIKLHGDYLDPDILNIESELESYTPELNRLLDQVFDEYGIVTCGWSADYDIALRAALERRATRRYACYWTHRGPIAATAEMLTASQGFIRASIDDADSFFFELASKVKAAAELTAIHPVSEALLIAEAKRALSSPARAIAFRDIAIRTLAETERQLKASAAFGNDGQISAQVVTPRLKELIAITRPMRRIMALSIFFHDKEMVEIAVTCFRRLLALSASQRSGATVFIHLKRAIPVSLLASAGVASLASGNFQTFGKMLELRDPHFHSEDVPVYYGHYFSNVVDESRLIIGQETALTALSNFFFGELRDEFLELAPDNEHFESLFDQYELLTAMLHVCPSDPSTVITSEGVWAPPGRFVWRRPNGRLSTGLWKEFQKVIDKQGDSWPPLSGGLFHRKGEIAHKVLDALTPFFQKASSRWQ